MKENLAEQNEHFHLRVALPYLEQFTQPVTSLLEEQKLLAQFSQEHSLSDKYRRGLVIGRFQPLHRGHIHLIKQALTLSETVIIGIGSANVINMDNPFSVAERELLLERALYREGVRNSVHRIVPINDYENDRFWLQEALRKTGQVDVIFGNNEWVNSIFETEGYTAIPIPLLQRGVYEGKKIRAKLREEGRL